MCWRDDIRVWARGLRLLSRSEGEHKIRSEFVTPVNTSEWPLGLSPAVVSTLRLLLSAGDNLGLCGSSANRSAWARRAHRSAQAETPRHARLCPPYGTGHRQARPPSPGPRRGGFETRPYNFRTFVGGDAVRGPAKACESRRLVSALSHRYSFSLPREQRP
jgi:hypothetical protein